MRKFITRNIAFPLQDYYNKTSILATYRFLLESQFWSESQMFDYRLAKLKKLLVHAYQNVPYYNSLFSSIKLKPGDIRTFEDLHKIPVLTKETARRENNNLISRNYSKRHVLKGITGGTTGPPLPLLRDSGDLSFTWAAFYRWYTWMGIDMGDRVTKIWGTRTVLSQPLKKRILNEVKNWYYNRSFVNSFDLNEGTLNAAINSLNSFKPVLIRGYLSALFQIAEFMKDNDISLTFKPKAVSSTTETVLDPFRQLIQKQFSAPFYDQYGCGECNSMAFEAGDGCGLYVAAEHVYIELLNDSNALVTNQEGRIILTNLDNLAMPFIRYENGDSAIPTENAANMKFNLPLIKSISGRTADTIVLANGSKVHGVFFTDILNELNAKNPDNIHRFQVYQDTPGEIEFRIESGNKPDDFYLLKLETALSRYFKKNKIITMKTLPVDPSGKFRYIVSSIINR
jgi:phenylacetate-CoA ligase